MNQPTTETLVSLVRDFLDPDPCQFDHHGYCQAHAAGFGGEPGSCPHGRARKLLAAIDAAAPAPVSADGQRRDRMRRALSTTRPSSLSSKHGPTEITAELDALVTAALGVADAEQQTLRAEVEQWRATFGRDALPGALRRLERAGEETEAHRLALSEALGLGTGAPWDAILDRAGELSRRDAEATAELRRVAGEEPATTETQDRAAIRAEAFRDAAGWAYLNVHASAAEGVRRWLLALADAPAAVARQDGEQPS